MIKKRKPIILALVSILASLSACSNDSDGSINRVCDAGYEACADACCAAGCCAENVCYDSDNTACGPQKDVCAPDQACIKGACTDVKAENACTPQQTNCSGACVMLSSDIHHCGDCTTVCAPDETCREGSCVKGCANGYTLIDGQCYDTDKDSEHCGEQDIACPPNTACVNGSCTCIRGYQDCDNDITNGCEAMLCPGSCSPTQSKCTQDGECIDLLTSPDNCGKCGNACHENESCVLGSCTTQSSEEACETSQTRCYDKCYALQNDAEHCGNCLTSCNENEKCIAGKCEIECGSLEKCDGACVDIQTSANHCGSCNTVCAANQTCVGGTCQCAQGFIDCDQDLTDKDGNPNPTTNGCESTIEACSCKPGTVQKCWRGDEKNVIRDANNALEKAKGICELGTQTCDTTGKFWGPCTGGTYPSALSCDLYGNLNGLDNDCDGKIDTTCKSECDLAAGEMSYIGCEYWSVYLDNLITTNHTLVFSNPSTTQTAEIYIYDKASSENTSKTPLLTLTVPPQEVVNHTLNTQTTNMCSATGSLLNAYRIRSTIPVTAYQFNPWDSASAHSNDASLLLPVNVLGKDYIAMTWHSESGNDHRSYITVLAPEPGETAIKIKTSSNVISGSGIEAMKPGDERTFTLKQFGVLTLMAPATETEDQTGTTIHADKNIVVFGGSRASYVPSSSGSNGCCRDHIEEQLLPTQAWGKSYYAVAAYNTKGNGDFWRILARDDNTTIKLSGFYNNELPDKTITLNAGQAYEAFNAHSFEVDADKPIVLGQFLPSKGYTGNEIGDPSFILTVPYEQYRSDYAFMVPQTYDTNYLTIIAPKGTNIELDGNPVTTFLKQGNVGNNFEFSYISITPGIHRMKADNAFGLYGYGYFNMASYGYPIGLDLKILNTN